MEYFGVDNTLVMMDFFFWPHLKKDEKLCSRYITYHKANSKLNPQSLYTLLHIPNAP